MSIKLMSNDKLRGFTLIEVMIAMLVSSVVLLALGGMLVMSIRTNQQSEHRMDAAATAQSVMANISARAAATVGYIQGVFPCPAPPPVPATAQCDAEAQLINQPWFTPTVALSQSPVPLSGLVTIAVTLAWQEHGVNKTVTLTSQVVI